MERPQPAHNSRRCFYTSHKSQIIIKRNISVSNNSYTVKGISPAPSNPKFGYIHVNESDERFFITGDRATKEGLKESLSVTREDLLAWKKEASNLYQQAKVVATAPLTKGTVRITNAYPNKQDDRYLTIWKQNERMPDSVHVDLLAKPEYAELKAILDAKSGVVASEYLAKAVYDSSIFFKNPNDGAGKYGEVEWAKENYRIQRKLDLISSWFPGEELVFTRIGKGAGELEFYDKTSDEGNKEIGLPDVRITCKRTGLSIELESTGSDILGKSDSFHLREDTKEKWPGTDKNKFGEFWIRPDKIGYMKRHPEIKVYIGLHYAGDVVKTVPGLDGKPVVVPPESAHREQITFIKPDINKVYEAHDWANKSKSMRERFVAFFHKDPEVMTPEQFKKSLANDLGIEEPTKAKTRETSFSR